MPTFRQDTKIGGMVPMMKTDDINDQAITKDKIRDGNVTTEKLADGAVSTDKLPDGAIKTPKIADGNITTSKLAEASVVTSKIADQNVTKEKIADQSVDNSKLSPESVTYDKVKNKAITTEKLNDRAVTTEKVEEKAITNAKIGDSAVDGRTIGEASVEKKHLANDSVATEKLQDSSVTSDKIHTNAVTEEKIEDSAISNPKLADNSVGTSKIKDGNITNEKVANNTLTIDKFDPELRKSIQAATGLPENLVEVIQDVDVEVKSLHSKDEDLQSQIADKQQQITANDKDIESLQNRSTQMEQSINNIAVTGGASVANTVAYSNTASGLVSINAQGAIDELAEKNATKAEKAEVTSELEKKFDKESILQESGNAEDKVMSQKAVSDKLRDLQDKKFDKENIAQEFGDSEDKVVSQFALPFREIESPEFIKAIVDAEDHFLFGIQLDGSIEWGKGIPAPIRSKLQEIINQCQQDKTDILEAINTAKEELSASIEALQEGKVDKEEGKSLIEDEVKECFRVIENEEFIHAVIDSEGRLLFGIYRDSGEPYFPINEMYHVEQNEEFFAVWLDAANHILLGIKRDGEIIGEIHAVNALKQVISQLQSDVAALQEKVGTIDTNLKELLNVFSLQDNEEYLAVEQDAEGKLIGYIAPDGSHYLYKVKSETIDAKVNKEDGKSLIDSDVADSHTTIEDYEGRTEITIDAEDKILGYRDSEGTRHEHKISAEHIELSSEAAKEVNESFKSAGIKMENPSDFSKDSHIELPIPRIAAQVRLYAPSLPATKQDDIEAEIEYNDKDGNYFRKPVILNAQGSSSMNYYVKNMAIDIMDGSEIKFGDFPTQDSFHLKKYYIDAFRGQCIVGYWLMEQVYKSRPIGQQYPYELSIQNTNVDNGFGDVKKDFFTGAKCHPDGFPIVITWIDNNGNETNMGVYTWNLKKSKEVYYADKKKAENIILDGLIYSGTLWGGNIKWEEFEVRNPKSLKDINGNKYDGDNPKELSETDKLSKKVKDYIIRWSGCKADIDSNKTKETFEKYFLINPFIDYYIVSQLLYNLDGFAKNWIWCTWDGLHWAPTLYDVDSIFGSHWAGVSVVPNSDNSVIFDWEVLGFSEVYDTEIKSRYKELRDLGIFSVNNIMKLLNKWLNQVGFDNLKKDLMIYDQTPSYRSSNINTEYWKLIRMQVYEEDTPYNETKTYSVNDTCYINLFVFQCVKECSGISPFTGIYSNEPRYGGYFNSPIRVRNWLMNRIKFLDSSYKYTI